MEAFDVALESLELCAKNDVRGLKNSNKWDIMLPQLLWHQDSKSEYPSQEVTMNPIYCQTSILATQTLLLQHNFTNFTEKKRGWFLCKQVLPGIWIIMKKVNRSLETKGLFKWFYLSSKPTRSYGLQMTTKVTVRGRKLYASQSFLMSGAATMIWLNGVNFAKTAHLITHLAPMKC